MKKKLSLLVLAVATAALTLAGCGSGTASNSEENVFRVGMEAGYAPFNWTQLDESNGGVKIDGSPEYAGGYDVEIAKKIADNIGKELVIVKSSLEALNKRVDFITYDEAKMAGTFVRYPERTELNGEINESLIVEFYNR